ncbi:MAG: CPBP family intramembrane metalloprotease, partial [Actinobacteria bacterium]
MPWCEPGQGFQAGGRDRSCPRDGHRFPRLRDHGVTTQRVARSQNPRVSTCGWGYRGREARRSCAGSMPGGSRSTRSTPEAGGDIAKRSDRLIARRPLVTFGPTTSAAETFTGSQPDNICAMSRRGGEMVNVHSTVAEPTPVSIDSRVTFDPKPLVAFFVLAYAISWAWVIPWAATGHTVFQGDGWPTHFPSLLGPLLAAFAVTAWTEGWHGVRDLLARMGRWRIGWRWWLAALSPLAFFFAVLGVMAVTGADVPARADFARFSGLSAGLGIVGVAVMVTIINAFGEETGWRGYALPHLQRRWGPITATLVLAALWAGWHI